MHRSLAAGALLLLLSSPTLRAGVEADALPAAIHLRLVQSPSLRIAVDVTVSGEADGETVMAVSEDWGGVPAERVDLRDATAASAGGEPLAVETLSHFRWKVAHPPGTRFTFSAWLEPNDLRKSGDSADHYRPLLEDSLFLAIAHIFLPWPESARESGTPVALTLSFEGFREAGWRVVHSLGVGSEPVEATLSQEQLSGLLFAAGELEVHERNIQGCRLAISLDATPWPFEGEEFADLVAEIIELERDFMQDPGGEFYWVNAISVGNPAAPGSSFGGTGLTNSFALYMQGNTRIEADSGVGPQVRRLIAHECFHEWNGLRIRLASPEEANYWFSEGFTDYFARRILFEGGLLDEKTYLEMLNQSLRDYCTSPVRNLPASELAKTFWTSRESQRQPYLRGDVIAMIVDHAIREQSRGERNLADLMQALLAEARGDPGQRFDTDELLAHITRLAGETCAAKVRGICVDGESAELPAGVLGQEFRVTQVKLPRFDVGFDVRLSLERKQVVGLRADSPAARAGVREGDALLACSVYNDRIDLPVSLTVRTGDAGEPRQLSFLPAGEEILVPRVLRAGD